MICPPCRTAADQHLPHDRCDNAGKDYAGCACEHQPPKEPIATVNP